MNLSDLQIKGRWDKMTSKEVLARLSQVCERQAQQLLTETLMASACAELNSNQNETYSFG